MSELRNALALPPLCSDVPVAGTYTTKLCKGGIPVAVRIYFGRPIINGARQHGDPQWCALVDGTSARKGELHDLDRVWPYCAKNPITLADYRFRLRRAAWARRYQPSHPAARPWEPIDLLAMPPRRRS